MPRPGRKVRRARGSPSSSTSIFASSARAWPASPSPARSPGSAGRSWCWRPRASAWSASGRNTGVVLPGFSVSADALIERVGLAQAKALWARSAAGAEYVRNAARDMPGAALSETGWLHVSKTDDIRAMAHEAALMAGEFGATVEPWPARPGARGAAFAALFPWPALSARLQSASAELRARSGGRGRSRRRPHLRGHAGAGDRSGGRAKARRHQPFPRSCRPCGAGRQRAYDGAGAAVRRDAVADLHQRRRHARRSATNCTRRSAFPAR